MNFYTSSWLTLFNALHLLVTIQWDHKGKKVVASEESILLSHMGPPKSSIKSLILVVEQFCIEHFLIFFQF